MADLTITSNSVQIVSSTSSQGLELYSGSGSIQLPTTNPSGATAGTPQVPAAVDDTGTLVWRSMSSGGGSADFNTQVIVLASINGTYTVADLHVGLAAPISAKVTLIGGGGGGAQIVSPTDNTSTGGGGGGATGIQYFNGLTPESTFIVTNGTGGAPGGAGGKGGDGLRTYLQYGDTIYGVGGGGGGGPNAGDNTTLDTCQGGTGGDPLDSGSANAPEIGLWGQNGGPGMTTTSTVLSGGFGGGTTLEYRNLYPFTSNAGDVAGINADGYGDGGSGHIQEASSGADTAPGSGAQGIVIFELLGAVA